MKLRIFRDCLGWYEGKVLTVKYRDFTNERIDIWVAVTRRHKNYVSCLIETIKYRIEHLFKRK